MLVSRETGETGQRLGEGEEDPAVPWEGAEPWDAPQPAILEPG